MVQSCSAFACQNRFEKGSGKSFHQFPLDKPELLKKWLHAVRRTDWKPSKYSVICSDHFTQADYGDKRLLKNAVPSVFNFPDKMQKQKSTRRCLKRKLPETTTPETPSASTPTEFATPQSVEMDHGYGKTPSVPREEAMRKTEMLRKRVRSLQQKTRRQGQKITKLTDLINELQNKNLIEQEPATVMQQCFDGNLLQIFSHELKHKDTARKGRRYSDELKKFALTLHYYSPQAYEYAKSIFTLPDVSSLRSWLGNVNCNPGFLTDVLDICLQLGEKYYSLIIDSMSIKKSTSYENGQYTGFCDYGGFVAEDSETIATEALVFLLVPLKGPCRQFPIGYFLVDKVNSRVQSELIKTALILTGEKNLQVRTITCDGAASNQSCFKLLGCEGEAVPAFAHPVLDYKVYVTLDICHMLKLARNALADLGKFFDKDNNEIRWEYIKKLSDLQDEIGLRFGNKLTKEHVSYQKSKMKVKLAAQVFSSSVADALEFLKNSQTPGFEGSEATIKFIRQVS